MITIAVNRFILHGQAFIPLNQDGVGDVVSVILSDNGREVYPIQVEAFLRRVLRYFGADGAALRRRYGRVIGKQQLVPLPLSREWVLVPFACREVIGRQSRIGWIVASYVEQIEPVSRTCSRIHLRGTSITVYHSREFCLQQMRLAHLVYTEFEALHARPQHVREARWLYD